MIFRLLLFFCLAIAFQSQAQQTTPNIIFILTDDQRWDALGHVGNEIIHTPNLDQLAAKSTYFNNAFVTTPICAASRASIMTGQYERTHDFTFSTPPLKAELVKNTYPALLKQAGYQSGFFGKFGMQMENRLDTTLFDAFYSTRTDGYFRLQGAGWSEHIHLTDLTTDKAIQFIESTSGNQPFCVSISYNAPHADDAHPQQYFWATRNDELYKAQDIPLSPLVADTFYQALPPFVKADSTIGRIRWRWRFDTPEKHQRMVKGYYRMISTIDDNVGRLLSTLEEMNVSENTIIIFTSDNGYFLGERGLSGKWLMYENSLRVPLLIYDPMQEVKPTNRAEIALNIDIAPTILDYAGVAIPPTIQGRSLRPLVNNESVDWRADFLCEHLYELQYIPKSEGVRSNDWKYFRYIDYPDVEELYYLKDDPLEQHNLVTHSSYQDTLQHFRQRLNQYISLADQE